MIQVSGNAITAIRGNTGRVLLKLSNYNLTSGDRVVFLTKDKVGGETIFSVEITSFIGGDAIIYFTSDNLGTVGTFVYDVTIYFADGDIDTVVQGTLQVKPV